MTLSKSLMKDIMYFAAYIINEYDYLLIYVIIIRQITVTSYQLNNAQEQEITNFEHSIEITQIPGKSAFQLTYSTLKC